jgi:enamine deaminase RidA (YjgF/YER057c/UK114 family)
MPTHLQRGARMSGAVIHNGTVYLSGQVDRTGTPSVAAQTSAVLAKIDALLAETGTDKSRVLSAQIWLADIRTFDEMNPVWEAWIDPAHPPARATVEARLAAPTCLVEIMVVAALPD